MNNKIPNNKKELKMKLTTILALIALSILIITTFIVLITKKEENKNTKEHLETNNNIITNDNSNEQIVNSDFSINFLKMENNKKNMIYSPLSIKYALKMLNEGATGKTKEQIENIIGNLDITTYNNIDNVLSLANSVYIRDTYSKYVKDNFKETLTQKYNAEINFDSFENANNINNWIENKTLGIIKNMVNDNLVQNPNTELVLINALVIDIGWIDSFDGSDTHGENFNLEDGSTMTATTMHKNTSSDNISYYKDTNVTSLTMNLKKYDDTQLEFIAIMPDENLSDYIKTLKIDDINNIINSSTLASTAKYGISISIPRFSFDYDLNLKDDLINLGITDAFDEYSAEFTNMSSKEDLFVGDALHKANIDFSEKGIKAAASTALLMKDNALLIDKNKPEEIKIDKPFLFLIRDKSTGEIWFTGTVYKPESWK